MLDTRERPCILVKLFPPIRGNFTCLRVQVPFGHANTPLPIEFGHAASAPEAGLRLRWVECLLVCPPFSVGGSAEVSACLADRDGYRVIAVHLKSPPACRQLSRCSGQRSVR